MISNMRSDINYLAWIQQDMPGATKLQARKVLGTRALHCSTHTETILSQALQFLHTDSRTIAKLTLTSCPLLTSHARQLRGRR